MATEKIQELADEYNIPTEVVEEYIEYMGFEPDEVDDLNYYGSFKNESDFAEQLVDEGIITDLGRYLYMTATDMRILAGEEADNRIENMDDQEILDETGDSYSPEEIDEAREYLKSVYYDEIHDALEKDAVEYFVENLGYEEQDLAKQSIFRVDYDKLGEDLEHDYNYIEHDGMVYVFNNYKRGGMTYRGGGIVTDLNDAYASDNMKAQLKHKMKQGDQIVAFAYTDYGGDFFDKVAIEYFKENHPENIVVERTAYNGQNGIVFGEPASEFLEAYESYILGYEDLEDFFYQMEYEETQDSFEFFLRDLSNYGEYKVSERAMDWLMENKSGGHYSMTTQGLDFSSSDLERELLEEGLIKKEDDDDDDDDSTDDENYAKGGNVPTIEKRVAEVNALIKEGNEKGVEVIDTSSTWQSPMKYKPFKYSNGVLYEEYEELNLYSYNRGEGTKWETKKYKFTKSGSFGLDDQKGVLNQVARWYRKAIKHFDNYGYADGGTTKELKLLVDSRHGVYVPKVFVERYDLKEFGFNDKDIAYFKKAFSDTSSDDYFDAYEEMESKAITKDGSTITTAEGNLWLVPKGYTYDDFFYAEDGGIMAKGGLTQHGLRIGDKIIDEGLKKKGYEKNVIIVRNDGETAFVNLDKGTRKDEYADGGMTDAKKKAKDSIDWDKELRDYAGNEYSKLSEREKESIISDMKKDFDRYGSFAKGGEVRYKLKGRNFGEQIENGQKFKELISKVYNNQSGESKYPENFIKETAFTTKIVKNKDDNTYWAKDYMYNGTLSKFTFLDDENFLKALALVDRPAIRKMEDGGIMAKGGMTNHGLQIGDTIKKFQGYYVWVINNNKSYLIDLNKGLRVEIEDKMVDGGVTFDEKVKSISRSLVERKKVSPSVQKDYGKTYSKKEAVESAKRIAGAMRKKEMLKKK